MKPKTRILLQDVFTTLVVIASTTLLLRLWPILLLAIVGSIVAVVRVLYLNASKEVREEKAPDPVPVYRSVEDEMELRTAAFRVLQKRITEALCKQYPDVRWVWETRDPMLAMEQTEPMSILLNRAGGYRRAQITVKNLQFITPTLESVQETPQGLPEPSAERPETEQTVEEQDSQPEQPIDYSFLAYNWVNDNLVQLNQMCNEALAAESKTVVIPAGMLPETESWTAICEELEQNKLDALVQEDAILLQLK